jgi:hypothetical protein
MHEHDWGELLENLSAVQLAANVRVPTHLLMRNKIPLVTNAISTDIHTPMIRGETAHH